MLRESLQMWATQLVLDHASLLNKRLSHVPKMTGHTTKHLLTTADYVRALDSAKERISIQRGSNGSIDTISIAVTKQVVKIVHTG
jgi:predicted metal-dependent RNase